MCVFLVVVAFFSTKKPFFFVKIRLLGDFCFIFLKKD